MEPNLDSRGNTQTDVQKKKDDLSRSRIPINATDTHAHVCACACMYNFFSTFLPLPLVDEDP